MSFLDRSFKRSALFFLAFLSIFAVPQDCSSARNRVWDSQAAEWIEVESDGNNDGWRAREAAEARRVANQARKEKTLRALHIVKDIYEGKKASVRQGAEGADAWAGLNKLLRKPRIAAPEVATAGVGALAPVVPADDLELVGDLDFKEYTDLDRYIEHIKTLQKGVSVEIAKKNIEQYFKDEEDDLISSLGEINNYNSASNIFLRALIPNYEGGSVKGIPSKIGLGFLGLIAQPFRKAVDSNLQRAFDTGIKKVFRSLRGIWVALGLASPLPAQTVASWSVVVKNYAAIMEKLGKAQVTDQGVTDMYAQRAANRPTKQTPKVSAEGSAEGSENPVVVVRAEENLDELAMFMKKAPRYVSISESFVRQMSNQINGIMHDMGDNYVDQREILSDILNTLDDVGKMIRSSYEKDNQPVLTQKLNGDLMACCSWLTSQLGALQDMINVDSEKSTPATTDSDPYGYGSSLRKR